MKKKQMEDSNIFLKVNQVNHNNFFNLIIARTVIDCSLHTSHKFIREGLIRTISISMTIRYFLSPPSKLKGPQKTMRKHQVKKEAKKKKKKIVAWAANDYLRNTMSRNKGSSVFQEAIQISRIS